MAKSFGAIALAGAIAIASLPRFSYSDSAPRQLVTANPLRVISADPSFPKYGLSHELLKNFIPENYQAVGFYSCAFKAENVRHDEDGRGVDFRRGDIVDEHKWGLQHGKCLIGRSTLYDPAYPPNDYLKDLKEGDVINSWHLILFSPDDAKNYLSGNKKGHPLCYPINCPPLILSGEGIDDIDKIETENERGGGEVLWRK